MVLPKLNQTGANEWADVQDNDEALKKVINGELDNGNLKAAAGIVGSKVASETITNENLAAAAKPFDWYTPKIIATEQTRESASFATLTTADEIKEVVLPENGLIAIGYKALVKASVVNGGKVALFLGANQLKVPGVTVPVVTESSTGASEAGTFGTVTSGAAGILNQGQGTSFVTTGQSLVVSASGGLCYVFAAAGTYNVSVQYRASSGNVTAKERTLVVGVLGV